MVKMIDVAKHAGVSIKTVSRVLNNEPHVQTGLREKVRESVRELGYVPSASARSLRSRRSYRIHVISHSTRSNFVNAIQFGALQACQEKGYQMVVSLLEEETADDQAALRQWCEKIMEDGKPDGFILVPPMSNDPKLARILSELQIPVVRIGPNSIDDDNATVTIDDRAAAREVVDYLLSLGHRRIAFVRGKEDQDSTHERFKGYRDGLYAAGIDLDHDLVKSGFFDFESGLTAGDALLEMEPRPTAIFAANDDMAAGVLVAAHRHGIAMPDDLSIVGFDDSEIAEKMWPALTTVRQPLQEFGARAIDALVAVAGKRASTNQAVFSRLDYELVLRRSTGPCP